MAQGTAQTTVDVGGDVETKWRYGALDEFMASCFGKAWVANVLNMGNDRITFSLATYAADIGVAGIARGAQVATMAFNFPGDNEVTVTTTFAARNWSDKADDTSFIIGAQPEASQRRFGFKDISGLKISGVQVGRTMPVSTPSPCSSTTPSRPSAALATAIHSPGTSSRRSSPRRGRSPSRGPSWPTLTGRSSRPATRSASNSPSPMPTAVIPCCSQSW